jgi:hypothetical protein
MTISRNSLWLTLAVSVCSVLLSGCGATTNTGGGSGGTGTPLNLPPGHTFQWAEQIGNQMYTTFCPTATSCSPMNQVTSTTTDQQGNVLITGMALTELPGAVNFALTHTLFVAKYSSSGTLAWIQQFGTIDPNGFSDLYSITTDSLGNIYVGGSTTSEFPGYTNPGTMELIVAKLDPSGNILWVQQYDPNFSLFNILGETMTLTPSGQLVFGWTAIGASGSAGYQSFLYVVDPNTAQTLWQQGYAGSNEMIGLTSDSQGNLIATGESIGTFPGNATSKTAVPYVVKFNGSTGDIIWKQTFSAEMSTAQTLLSFASITTDSNNNILIGGATTTSPLGLCQGLCNLPSVNDQSAVVAKLNGATGTVMWFKGFSTGLGDGATGVTVDSNNNAFAVGFTNGSMADGFTQPTDDLFALKMDTNGNVIWAQQYGAGIWTSPGEVPYIGIKATTDTAGNLFVGGETTGALPGNSNPTGLGEAFVIKFGP